MDNETLHCETCGKSHWDTPIVEKPLRYGYRSNIVQLKRSTGDHRIQENICLDCLKSEINNSLKKKADRKSAGYGEVGCI